MTKEEFEQYLIDRDIDALIIKRFFESNVVIPKGANRHPYADVLHEIAEDNTKIVESNRHGKIFSIDRNIPIGIGAEIIKIRIKQSKPVYEWQYALDNGHGVPIVCERFYTDEEYELYVEDKDTCIKLPWTKRERK